MINDNILTIKHSNSGPGSIAPYYPAQQSNDPFGAPPPQQAYA